MMQAGFLLLFGCLAGLIGPGQGPPPFIIMHWKTEFVRDLDAERLTVNRLIAEKARATSDWSSVSRPDAPVTKPPSPTKERRVVGCAFVCVNGEPLRRMPWFGSSNFSLPYRTVRFELLGPDNPSDAAIDGHIKSLRKQYTVLTKNRTERFTVLEIRKRSSKGSFSVNDLSEPETQNLVPIGVDLGSIEKSRLYFSVVNGVLFRTAFPPNKKVDLRSAASWIKKQAENDFAISMRPLVLTPKYRERFLNRIESIVEPTLQQFDEESAAKHLLRTLAPKLQLEALRRFLLGRESLEFQIRNLTVSEIDWALQFSANNRSRRGRSETRLSGLRELPSDLTIAGTWLPRELLTSPKAKNIPAIASAILSANPQDYVIKYRAEENVLFGVVKSLEAASLLPESDSGRTIIHLDQPEDDGPRFIGLSPLSEDYLLFVISDNEQSQFVDELRDIGLSPKKTSGPFHVDMRLDRLLTRRTGFGSQIRKLLTRLESGMFAQQMASEARSRPDLTLDGVQEAIDRMTNIADSDELSPVEREEVDDLLRTREFLEGLKFDAQTTSFRKWLKPKSARLRITLHDEGQMQISGSVGRDLFRIATAQRFLVERLLIEFQRKLYEDRLVGESDNRMN